MDIWKELKQEGVDPGLLRRSGPSGRPPRPAGGRRTGALVPASSTMARRSGRGRATALLCGEHLLLAGPKATGKNVLAENLAAAFGRPAWDVSMYVNVDAAALIGADTLQDGQVAFREGPRLPVRPAGRLRRAGRGEHGQK